MTTDEIQDAIVETSLRATPTVLNDPHVGQGIPPEPDSIGQNWMWTYITSIEVRRSKTSGLMEFSVNGRPYQSVESSTFNKPARAMLKDAIRVMDSPDDPDPSEADFVTVSNYR